MEAADLAQHTIDAVADTQEFMRRLEMEVRRPSLDRVREQGVDQPHHRLAVLAALRLQAPLVDLAGLDLVQDAVDRQLVPVESIDGLVELHLAGEHGPNLHPRIEQRPHLIHGDDVERIRRRDGEPPRRRLAGEREYAIAPGDLPRHELHDLAVDQDLRQIDAVVSVHAREHVADDAFGGESETHEDAAEGLVAMPLLGPCNPYLILADHTLCHQQLADTGRPRSIAGGGRPGRLRLGPARPCPRIFRRQRGGRRPRSGGRGRLVERGGDGPVGHGVGPAGAATIPSGAGWTDVKSAPVDTSRSRMRRSTASISKLAGRLRDRTSASR